MQMYVNICVQLLVMKAKYATIFAEGRIVGAKKACYANVTPSVGRVGK
jgi:hypothetical protein